MRLGLEANVERDLHQRQPGIQQQFLGAFDPRHALKAATSAARELCVARFEAFGCAGQAERIKPMPLDAMARKYH